MSHRAEQLKCLLSNLGELVYMLGHDPNCKWRSHFTACQQRASVLADKEFTQSDLNDLSASVMSVYGAAGSFSDYAPVRYTADGKFSVIEGMEGLSEVSGRVYSSAFALRIVGDAA
jgi:hypothetical protein